MNYEEQVEIESRKMTRASFAMNMSTRLLYHGDFSFTEAINLCSKLREYIMDLFPDSKDVFDLYYAPRLRKIIHEVYD
ncbi:MAG: hypothetical protein KAR07_10885 [Spirochaetes bacterium]|nr:hypothetical protein [Spirochaetota bacterium]MCK5268669.1 hypothetical protein [Spirochaetota bacterium]